MCHNNPLLISGAHATYATWPLPIARYFGLSATDGVKMVSIFHFLAFRRRSANSSRSPENLMIKGNIAGGGRGIRTPGALRLNGFQDWWALYHPLPSFTVCSPPVLKSREFSSVSYHPIPSFTTHCGVKMVSTIRFAGTATFLLSELSVRIFRSELGSILGGANGFFVPQ